MTSPQSTAGSLPRAGTKAAPGRRAPISPLRRTARAVLVIGTLLAAAAAFGPTWAVRTGIAVAVVAAVVACVLAWREITQARRSHARAMLASSQEHGQALRTERTHNASVLDTLTVRAQAAGAEITRQQGVISGMKVEISTLRGDKAFLKSEIKQREAVIAGLRETVRAREAELLVLRNEGDDAEIHPMPRRVLTEHESEDVLPDADDLWSDESHPTVVDLRAIDPRTVDPRMIDPRMIDTAMVLPNYEEDRRLA